MRTHMLAFFAHWLGNERGSQHRRLGEVLAIAVVAAMVLIPNLERSQAHAQLATSRGDLTRLATALEVYFGENAGYPATLATLVPAYVRATSQVIDPCSHKLYVYTPLGSPATSYTLQTPSWEGLPCGRIARGLSYEPEFGLVQQ